MKGSKLKKVEIKISINNIKVEDVKTKVALFCLCVFVSVFVCTSVFHSLCYYLLYFSNHSFKFLQEELYSYPLHRISYCADDKRDKKLFAFIAKDSGQQHHNCYVFECEKMVNKIMVQIKCSFTIVR